MPGHSSVVWISRGIRAQTINRGTANSFCLDRSDRNCRCSSDDEPEGCIASGYLGPDLESYCKAGISHVINKPYVADVETLISTEES